MLVYSPAPGLGALPSPTTACVQAPCNEGELTPATIPDVRTFVLPPPTQQVTSPPIMCIKAPCEPGTVQTTPPSSQQVNTTTAAPTPPVVPAGLPTVPAATSASSISPKLDLQTLPYAKILAGVGVLFLGFSAVKFLSR